MKVEYCVDSKRERKCRWCELFIPIGVSSIAFKDVDMRSKRHNIHFHEDCWDEMIMDIESFRSSQCE